MRRLLVVAAATAGASLSLPGVAAANGGHAGPGPNLPLLVAGGVVLMVSGGVLLARRRPRWVGVGGLVAAAALGTLAFSFRGADEASPTHAVVTIVEPQAGAEVPAGEPVTIAVEVENGTVAASPTDTEGGHLHLYVDGDLQQMPYSTEIDVELAPGTHELTVEYVDERHVSFDPPIQSTITLTARR